MDRSEMDLEANLQTGQAPSLQLSGERAQKSPHSISTDLQGSGVVRKLRKIAFVIAAFALVFMVVGSSYQFIKARSDARRFPQEGKSVDVGGYKLNINCIGQGSPTVVLEAGLTVPAISWRAVQHGIARFTRACSYDRAGYDWSDPGPMPRTSSQSTKELHILLHNAGEKPPYVLVGHSFGGTNARIYDSLYPREVAAMVLVDPGHEDLKFPATFQNSIDDELKEHQQDQKWVKLLYWFGVSRFLAGAKIDNPTFSYDKQEWWYLAIQPKFVYAATSEWENLEEGKQELRAASQLGDKPLVVLIAGKNPLTSQEGIELHNSWVDLEKSLVHLSTRGKWVMVPDTGHMIPAERPEAIVSAVQEVSAAANVH
jgi:pimeloyl-ACP methyl ester carboxylesterase